VAGLQRLGRRDQHALVPGAGDLEEDEEQLLEPDLLVVGAPGREHVAVEPDQVLGAQTAPAGGRCSGLDGGHGKALPEWREVLSA
jgi:hypothetical protein